MQVKVLGWSKRVITESATLLLLNMTPRRRDYFHHRAKRCNHLAFLLQIKHQRGQVSIWRRKKAKHFKIQKSCLTRTIAYSPTHQEYNVYIINYNTQFCQF